MLRAIVFDFDGVIANSEPLHFRAYRDVLVDEAVALTESEYYSRYLGYDDYGAFAAIGVDRQRPWSSSDIQRMIQQKAARMETLERDESVLFPGAETAIRTAANAMPIAIASGALGIEIRRVLDRSGLTRLFSAIVAAEDTAQSKPSPDPYLRAVALLSSAHGAIEAAECAAIEDSQWGLESARSAGLRTIAVAQTYEASKLTADLVIPAMTAFDLRAIRKRLG